MRNYAADKGWTIVKETPEIGSDSHDRPQRAVLIKAARRREIDGIVVWRLDRLGWSLADLVMTLKELAYLKVAFVSLTEGFDLTTATRAPGGLQISAIS